MLGARLAYLALGALAPLGLGLWLLRRAGRSTRLSADTGAVVLGALAYALAAFIERAVTSFTGVDGRADLSIDPAVLAYAFLVAAPLEQGLKLAAFLPIWRSKSTVGRRSAVMRAALCALGFVTARSAHHLATAVPDAWAVLQAWLGAPVHLFFAAMWGFVLGRDPRKRVGGRAFDATWLVAMLFNGLVDQVLVRGHAALIAVVPILGTMAIITLAGSRAIAEHERRSGSPKPRRFLSAIEPPSLEALRGALRRTERPVTIGWILFGALVTTGVITAMLAFAVVLGHRLGVDFAAVDRGESSQGGAVPLVLLGAATLGAFPVAGYLVARASATHSVLEPALSAALAILGTLVLLGLAAPVSLLFALAFAPIAFGLACAGAWVGVGR